MPKGVISPNPHRTATEASRERQRRWRENNREKIREQHKRWRDAHPEDRAAALQRWRDRNPDKVRAQSRRQYDKQASAARNANLQAKRLGVIGTLTADDVRALDPNCTCGRPGTTLDHKIALGLGGPNVPSNIQWLCDDCNLVKTADDIRASWDRYHRPIS